MPKVPIPNQPVFAWPITFSTINVIGRRVNTGGAIGPIGVYGSVLTGTQMIVPVLAESAYKYKQGVFIHGFQMPSKTIVGASRLRIPLIVMIWNYVLTGINVIATVGSTEAQATVYAEASHDTGAVHATYMILGGIETEKNIRLIWNISNIKHHIYTMFTSIPIFRRKVAGISMNIVTPEAGVTAKLITHLRSKLIETPVKLSVSLTRKLFSSVAKLTLRVLHKEVEQTGNMSVQVGNKELEQVANLNVNLTNESQVVGKLSVRVAQNIIEKFVKLKVALTPVELQKVMSYILTFLIGHKMTQRTHVRADTHKYDKVHTIHTEATYEVKQRSRSVFSMLATKLRQRLGLNLSRLESRQELHAAMHSAETKARIALRPLELQIFHAKIQARATVDWFQHHSRMLFHSETLRDEYLYAEFVALPLETRDRLIKFAPRQPVEVRQLSVMVTVCETWVLAYLNFVPDELVDQLRVSVGLCSHFATSIIQWYLHGGRISNEGYGNQVIFDLGDVNPIGPIPPVPSRQWEGGYVEDPFKGVGYVPASDSVGYNSPSDWVSNAKMWWKKPTEPFQGGE